jgi:hypothetical protein
VLADKEVVNSLNQISKNLEDINSTLKEKKSSSICINPEKELFDDSTLISLVDERFERSVTKIVKLGKAGFSFYAKILLVCYYIAIFAVIGYLLYLLAQGLPALLGQPINIQLAVGIAITSSFIALTGLGVNIQKMAEPENQSLILGRYNYKKLKAEIESQHPDKLALLKALVILKSRQPDLNLSQFLQAPISNDKVFEILYTNDYSLE